MQHENKYLQGRFQCLNTRLKLIYTDDWKEISEDEWWTNRQLTLITMIVRQSKQ